LRCHDFLTLLAGAFIHSNGETREKDGYDPEVIITVSLKPLDLIPLALPIARKTHDNYCGRVHENWGRWRRVTASINDRLFDELDAPVLRHLPQDIPPYNGKARQQLLQPEQIIGSSAKNVALRV